jgi:hypothetical protein
MVRQLARKALYAGMMAAVIAVAIALPAAAVSNGTLGISPASEASFFHLSLAPGAQTETAALVSNNTSAAATVLIYPVDATNTATGDFAFGAQTEKPLQVGVWSNIGRTTLTIKAHSVARVPLTVSVPAGTTPGDYAGGIIIQSPPVIGKTSTSAPGGAVSRIDVVQRQGVRIYLHVDGTATASLARSALSWKTSNNAVAFTLPVTNTGTTILHPIVTLTIASKTGSSARTVKFNTVESLFPGRTIMLHAALKNPPLLEVANLTATTTSEATTQKSTGVLVIIPWWLIVTVLVALALLAFGIVRLVKYRRKVRAAFARLAALEAAALGLVFVLLIAAGALGHVPAAQAAGNSPAAVALGAAGNFSVLGASVANNDTSNFEHDIGAYPGAITGFPPGTTSGSIHPGDQAAQDGQAALKTAYMDAASRTPATSITGDQIGITLTPGVYSAAAAISNTGTMTLDGGGDPHAVFIFQLAAALNLAASTKIVLANGTVLSNVFWQVAGAVTVGADATFSGILLGNTAVSLGAGVTLAGSALSLNGAITIDGGVVSTSPGFSGDSANPNLIALGTAGNFSVLGTSIANTESTRSNLNVGATPGGITGYPPGTTAGSIHTDDSVAVQAMTDLSSAYSTAATRSSSAAITGDLNGSTIQPGVYRAGAAIALSGTLTLDAKGDPTSVFLFQIKAAFSVAAAAKIVLINNAQPGNVFWQVAGATTIGAGTHFVGTILGNAAITVGAGSRIAGALLTQGGAISTASTAASTTAGYNGSLTANISGANFDPIVLTGLTATATAAAASQWSITDTRRPAAPWSLTLTATAPVSTATGGDAADRMLPEGSLALDAGTVSGASAVTSAHIALSTVAQRLIWTSGDRGTFTFTPVFSQSIPANTFASNTSTNGASQANPYVSVVTATIG